MYSVKRMILPVTVFVIAAFSFIEQANGQICGPRFSTNTHKGISFIRAVRMVINNYGESIVAGDVYDMNGMIAKFSPGGTPLWSNQYTLPFRQSRFYYKDMHFRDLIKTSDSSVLAAGTIMQQKFVGISEFDENLAILIKSDKYGVVTWGRSFESGRAGNLSALRCIETRDGDYIVYIGTDNGFGVASYGKICRIGSAGQLKWTTLVFSDSFQLRSESLDLKRALLQTSDGHIVVGDAVYKINKSAPAGPPSDGNLHFYKLNYATGQMIWETSYQYPAAPGNPAFVPGVEAIRELPGKLQFFTAWNQSTTLDTAKNLKPVCIQTNETGDLQKIIAYDQPGAIATNLLQATNDPGRNKFFLLTQNSNQPVLSALDQNGMPVWSGSYDTGNGAFPVTVFAPGPRSFSLFESSYQSWYSRLLITDSSALTACAEMPGQLFGEEVPFNGLPYHVLSNTSSHYTDEFEYDSREIKTNTYPLEYTRDCEPPDECCHDFVDSININQLRICEGQSIRLPDQSLVNREGLYYVTFKTQKGCDSVRFYHVQTDKNIASLSLGEDTCLTGTAQIVLHATPGFGTYTWMGSFVSGNEYPVRDTGLYRVTVSNICGTKTDSIQVYAACDFPVYIPSAFTPNHDGRNDLFGVPEQNKNKLIKFSVFNRWGEMMYSTREKGGGWDGSFKNRPLDTGTFVWMLEMEGLSGKSIRASGTVTLIR